MARIYEAEEEVTIPAGCYDAICIEVQDQQSYSPGAAPAFKFVFEFNGGHRIDALASAVNQSGKFTKGMKAWAWKNALIGRDAAFDLDLMGNSVPCCVEVVLKDNGFNAVQGVEPQYGIHAAGSRGTMQVPGTEVPMSSPNAQPPAPAPQAPQQTQYAQPVQQPVAQSQAPPLAPVPQQQYAQQPPPVYDPNGQVIEDPFPQGGGHQDA